MGWASLNERHGEARKVRSPHRIVADVGPDAKSRVALKEQLPLDGELKRIRLTNLWMAPLVPADNRLPFDGGFVPFSMSQAGADAYAMTLVEYASGFGQDEPGMHSTGTIDHFYVVEGEIVMVLETGEAHFCVGDTGIIRGAAHGWRNDGGEVAKLIFFVLPAESQKHGN